MELLPFETTEAFYNTTSQTYSDSIVRCVPRYNEMTSALVQTLELSDKPLRILELGVGTGLLTKALRDKFPDCLIDAVDFSENMLSECRERVGCNNINYIHKDFKDLEFPSERFDFIASSISIHHLIDNDKIKLFNKCFDFLKPNGTLIFSDQFRGETEDIYEMHINSWHQFAESMNVSLEEWNKWMEHQSKHDHHASIRRHFDWLEKSGFTLIDCIWRNMLWGIIVAYKKV